MPRIDSPRRRERRTRSRSYSPRPSFSRRRSGSRSPRETRRSRSPEWRQSPRRRSPQGWKQRSRSPQRRSRSPQRRSRSPQRRSRSPQRRSRSLSYERSQPVKRVAAADSSGKRVSSYRSRSPSPVHAKRARDDREYREPRRDDRRYSPIRSQERDYSPRRRSPRGRSPSPRRVSRGRSPSPTKASRGRSPSPRYSGKLYSDKASSSRAPEKKRDTISSVTIPMKNRLEKLDKRFQTLEQISRGAFDFEENITIGIHRGPHHVNLDDEDIEVNYDFNPKTFLMLFPKKETFKAIFDRDEILQFHHDDILDEEAYVEKRTITVKPTDKPKPKWSDSVDYKITIGGRSSRVENYDSDRRMVRDSGRRRSSRDIEPEVTVRLDPKPDPRYERLFRASERRGDDRDEMIRDPHDLRHSLNKRHRDGYESDEGRDRDRSRDRDRGRSRDGDRDRGRDRDREDRIVVQDARRKIEARRSIQGGSLDRAEIQITKTERREMRRSVERLKREKGRASLEKELPDFKNRPDEVSPIPCLFFKRGRCQRGADCKFTHDLAKASQRPPIKRRLSRSPEDTYNEPPTSGRISTKTSTESSVQRRRSQGPLRSSARLVEPEENRFLDRLEPSSSRRVDQRLKEPDGEIQKVWVFGTGEMKDLRDLGRQSSLGTDLGLLSRNIMVYWYCKRGMKIKDILPAVHRKIDKGFTPKMIVLHCGGNDLGDSSDDIEAEIRLTVDAILNELPEVKIVWSMILPRWLGRSDVAAINRQRDTINERIARFVLDSGGCYLRYPTINLKEDRLYRESHDGDIILSTEGQERLLATLKGGIVSILLRNVTIAPELVDLEPLVEEFVKKNIKRGKFGPLKRNFRPVVRRRGSVSGKSRGRGRPR